VITEGIKDYQSPFHQRMHYIFA